MCHAGSVLIMPFESKVVPFFSCHLYPSKCILDVFIYIRVYCHIYLHASLGTHLSYMACGEQNSPVVQVPSDTLLIWVQSLAEIFKNWIKH